MIKLLGERIRTVRSEARGGPQLPPLHRGGAPQAEGELRQEEAQQDGHPEGRDEDAGHLG